MEISKLENTVTEIKDSMDECNSIMERAEGRLTELEDSSIDTTQSEQQRENAENIVLGTCRTKTKDLF